MMRETRRKKNEETRPTIRRQVKSQQTEEEWRKRPIIPRRVKEHAIVEHGGRVKQRILLCCCFRILVTFNDASCIHDLEFDWFVVAIGSCLSAWAHISSFFFLLSSSFFFFFFLLVSSSFFFLFLLLFSSSFFFFLLRFQTSLKATPCGPTRAAR